MIGDVDFDRVARRDLIKHLEHRIDTLFDDFYKRCMEVRIEHEDAAAAAMDFLVTRLACEALAINADEEEFVMVCVQYFRKMRAKRTTQ